MFSKANIISTIVATVWGMGGGFLLWGIIAEPLMKDHIILDGLLKETPDMVFLAIGTLIQGFAFSTIYSRFGSGNYGGASGFTMGILLAVLIGFGEKLIDYATANMMNLHATLINGVVYLVFFGVMGLLVGFIYAKISK